MLKRKLCEAVITWEFACAGPLLIADGRYSQDQVMAPFEDNRSERDKRKGWYPDKFFINKTGPQEVIERVRKADRFPPEYNFGFYVPGTSIRGPFRAHAERIIRSLRESSDLPPFTACDPFEEKAEEARQGEDDPKKLLQNCAKREEDFAKSNKELKGKTAPYARACPTCKLFGYAGLASRISFADADIVGLNGPYRSIYRDMIGIDRFTGGVFQGGDQGGGANMRFHVLENTRFTTTVTVTNFELWQLGLMAYVFRDFEDPLADPGSDNPQGFGLVPLGFGKTKGFGLVRGKVTSITLAYPRHLAATDHLHHLGSLMAGSPDFDHYGFQPQDAPPFHLPSPHEATLSLYHRFSLTGAAIQALWVTAAPAFNSFIAGLIQAAAPPSPAGETT